MTAVSLEQEPRPLIVGERINSQGSRKIKRLLLEDNYDDIALVAREQVEGGAHVLDVCVALTERPDEDVQMREVVRKLAQSTEAPLMIDSTEPRVVEIALQNYPGRAIVNSVHLEAGRAKIDVVMPTVVEHGAAVVALTIDEVGMAKTAERKLEVARRIHGIVCGEYGLPPGALIFDDLTFTLATGEPEFLDSAVATIDGIRLIKRELPGVLTSLGVSNVSFGLKPPARAALNSVFLHHCVEAGLDCALVHPKDITPYFEIENDVRELCDDLVFNRRPDALARFIERFEGADANAARSEQNDAAEEELPVAERIHQAILRRRKDGIEGKIDEALLERSPVDVLNEILLPAMKDVGDRFGRGELILPFVLQSAEVMKKAVAHLEQFLEKTEGSTKGTVVLATVFGDVHDIGKNLVNTILTNNGYTVHDLGKQVPMNTILEKAVAVNADAIGLSALLVSTSKQMPICVQEQDSRGLHFPVIVGGAAINRDFGRRISLLDEGERYFDPGLFYAKDAFEGLEIMDAISGDATRREELVSRARKEAFAQRDKARNVVPVIASDRISTVKGVRVEVPAPPFWGVRTLEDIDLADLWPRFDLKSLYRLSWGAANAKGEAFDKLVNEEFEPRLERYKTEAVRDGILRPKVVYGYFPAAGAGNEIILYDPARRNARNRASADATPNRRRTLKPCRLPARAGKRSRDGRRSAASRHGRNASLRTNGSVASCRRLQRILLPPRLHRTIRRSARRIHASSYSQRAEARRRNRQALLLGLRRLPRSRPTRDRLQIARRNQPHRRNPNRSLPNDPRAIHRRNRHASPQRIVLQRRRYERASSLVGALEWAKRRAPGSV